MGEMCKANTELEFQIAQILQITEKLQSSVDLSVGYQETLSKQGLLYKAEKGIDDTNPDHAVKDTPYHASYRLELGVSTLRKHVPHVYAAAKAIQENLKLMKTMIEPPAPPKEST